jgi:hypothetical protein
MFVVDWIILLSEENLIYDMKGRPTVICFVFKEKQPVNGIILTFDEKKSGRIGRSLL